MAKLITASHFRSRLSSLLVEASAKNLHAENSGCVQCSGCSGCTRSTFCRDSQALLRCHYCVACTRCSDCTHCRDSESLTNCKHSRECSDCSNCAYVFHSTRLLGCTYCFGCVGLAGVDFHILNEPYRRNEYFELVRHLMQELEP